jgi:hypothetical protein
MHSEGYVNGRERRSSGGSENGVPRQKTWSQPVIKPYVFGLSKQMAQLSSGLVSEDRFAVGASPPSLLCCKGVSCLNQQVSPLEQYPAAKYLHGTSAGGTLTRLIPRFEGVFRAGIAAGPAAVGVVGGRLLWAARAEAGTNSLASGEGRLLRRGEGGERGIVAEGSRLTGSRTSCSGCRGGSCAVSDRGKSSPALMRDAVVAIVVVVVRRYVDKVRVV